MKNIFIFLSIFIIGLIAFIDAKDRFAELDEVAASKTPSQIEIKPQLNTKDVKSHSLDFKQNENTQNIHDKLRQETKQDLQKNIDEWQKSNR